LQYISFLSSSPDMPQTACVLTATIWGSLGTLDYFV